MKQKLVFQSLLALAAVGFAMSVSTSCTPKDEHTGQWDDSVVGTATVSGVVKDTFDNPLADVDVTFMGTTVKREVRATAKTGGDGSFSVASVPSNARYITFSKQGYATVAYTLEAKRFVNEDNIVLEPVLEFSAAIIKGLVYDASTGKPWAGVQVTCGSTTTTTGTDGSFALEGLTLKGYTLTYTAADGTVYSRNISASQFIDGTAEVPAVYLGGESILPGGKKYQDLAECDIWYSNNYHGSDGFNGINDWTCGYMSAFNYYGQLRYEAEGCALFTDPAFGTKGDSENFNSYIYGRKRIEEGNKIMNVHLRTHYAGMRDPIHFDVAVVNLTDGVMKAELVGEQTHGSGDYKSYSFDLSKWVGKDVVLALGVYYNQKSDDLFHMPMRRICFAPEAVNGDDALPGTPVEGAAWRGFTQENVSSMTVNEKTSFTGRNLGYNSTRSYDGPGSDISPRHKHNPGGQQGYDLWRGTNHIGVNWAFQYVSKDVEPVNSEGYTIKTRSGVDANYNTPETYLYARFHITDANDKMHLLTRTFSSANPTVFRVTAVPVNTLKAVALAPVSNTANQAKASQNGCWEFIHEKGAGTPADYADFTYDLSAYKGQDVVIALGVYKGQTRDGEQKLCIYGIEME